MSRRRATPSDPGRDASSATRRLVSAPVAGCPRFAPSCTLQMIDHLRLVSRSSCEEVLGQRLGSRQPKPIALERDRAAGALHRLDEGNSAHGAGLAAGRPAMRATARRVGAAACWNRSAGQFRWSVSDGGWSVPGRTARRILQHFQCAGQFGQFGQFSEHRSPRVAQFARACAASCTIERRRGHISTSQPTASRKSDSSGPLCSIFCPN